MWFHVLVWTTLATLSCGGLTPVYTPGYANVNHQGTVVKQKPGFDTKEEVTEPSTDGDIPLKNCDEVNPTGADTTTEAESEKVNFKKVGTDKLPKKLHEALELEEEFEATHQPDLEPTDSSAVEEQGVYYIYHPNGLLQRVNFLTKDDSRNMEYLVNFNYKDVEPIAEPLYTYDPNTLEFQKLQLG
ncbi:hypothetical protein NQ315_008665 [Exocentrus adspersus]|uniref:Uncharacterized protein n=1 Tax=Exocentrus adspersus TaxID=1586481 RepID=A0AAV8W7A8_9CUCU|nr:hypothetical protein NQ315_008665 [Exocentrus adspersus]